MPLQNGERGVFLKPCWAYWPQKCPTSVRSPSHAGGTRGLGQSDATDISRNATSFGGDTQGGRWLTALAQVRCKNKCYLYWRATGGCVTVALGGWKELREKYITGKKSTSEKNIFLTDVFVKILIWWKMLPIQCWKTTLTEYRQVLKNSKDKKFAELWKLPVRPNNRGKGIENGGNLTRQRCQRCWVIPTSMSCQQYHYWIIRAD